LPEPQTTANRNYSALHFKVLYRIFKVMDETRARIVVEGLVQGVGFRYYSSTTARYLKLTGYARNTSDGKVEIEVEGDHRAVQHFIEALRIGPRSSRVISLHTEWQEPSHRETSFEIR
jgi:acylphosphatase